MPVVKPGRWAYTFCRRGKDFRPFVTDYFGSIPSSTLLICGAGFDPRAVKIPQALAAAAGNNMDAWLLREDRPAPREALTKLADEATARLQNLFRSTIVVHFDVFESDGALAVPGSLLERLPKDALCAYSDVVLDTSSLSLGVAYPLAKWLHESSTSGVIANLHLMVTAAPMIDRTIRATYDDLVQSPKGFFRPPVSDTSAAVMWVPQLQHGLSDILERIGGEFEPNDICPVVPFPTKAIRDPEQLFVEYERLLNGAWRVDQRDVIYAAENDPLDIYRILVRITRERAEVFRALGASEVVLTPMGSKVVALGSLMAALELDLSVRYVEARDYSHDFQNDEDYEMISVWLHGGPSWNSTIES